jgi:beta-lactamase superfamily II metal-dependent hydrolase
MFGVKYFYTFVGFLAFVSLIATVPITNSVLIQNYTKNEDDLVITFMDVGHGDAIFIHKQNHTMIVDCGGYYPNIKILMYLANNNVNNIDFLVLTHNHLDHTCSSQDIQREHNVETLYTYNNLHRGETFVFTDNVIIEVMNPPQINNYELENDKSIVLKVKYDNVSVLLTGDATKTAEKNMIDSGVDLDSDILKVAHHGGCSSTDVEFVNSVSPDISIISTEFYRISYNEIVEETLRNFGSKIYDTDTYGDIVVVINDGNYMINTLKIN